MDAFNHNTLFFKKSTPYPLPFIQAAPFQKHVQKPQTAANACAVFGAFQYGAIGYLPLFKDSRQQDVLFLTDYHFTTTFAVALHFLRFLFAFEVATTVILHFPQPFLIVTAPVFLLISTFFFPSLPS